MDMARAEDRKYLQRAISARWKLDEIQLDAFPRALQAALEEIIDEPGLAPHTKSREIRGIARVMAAIVAQRQSDEQLIERQESGMADSTVRIEVVRE